MLYLTFTLKVFNKLKIPYSIVYLPIKKKRYTVLSSPHVNKSSKEQFEIRSFTCFIYLKSRIDKTTLKSILLNKPKGIKIALKVKEDNLNGKVPVSKTGNAGSNPALPVFKGL